MSTSQLRRQCSRCLVVVKISCPVSCTTVATSPRHHPLLCPRTDNLRMLLTLMSSAAVAHGDVAATSTSETTAPLPLVVKLPVLDRSGRAVTRQRRNTGKRRSSSACVQELGICSIRNIRPRPASTFHLDLIHFRRIWSKDTGNNTIVSTSEPPALLTTTSCSQPSPYSARAHLIISNRSKSAGNLMDRARI